jgi:hypothetical protein
LLTDREGNDCGVRSDALTGLARGPFCVVEVGNEWVKVAKVRHGVVESVAAAPWM